MQPYWWSVVVARGVREAVAMLDSVGDDREEVEARIAYAYGCDVELVHREVQALIDRGELTRP